jgi:cytochrome c
MPITQIVYFLNVIIMKRKFLFVATGIAFLISCGSGDDKTAEKKNEHPSVSAPAPAAPTDNSENPDYQKGLALVGKSGCLSCHAVADQVNGPAYRDIAAKYAGASDTIVGHLAKKVLSGGMGVWGEIPMPAQPVTEPDAEAMVKYILLLKQ